MRSAVLKTCNLSVETDHEIDNIGRIKPLVFLSYRLKYKPLWVLKIRPTEAVLSKLYGKLAVFFINHPSVLSATL